LPIGGYSYSQGLEMAVDNGRVQDAASARLWISDQLLLNLARFEAPLLLAHCRAAAEQDWPQLAQLCEELGGAIGAIGVCDGSAATRLRLWTTSVWSRGCIPVEDCGSFIMDEAFGEDAPLGQHVDV